eukprot:GHUV01032192.1.p1 GENE.GHUV01032192.1~~GHUV01032192.1.p1  ORF type:complete len:557 (+),score=190.43 GHUV01032192.1:1035-2705(+)
MGLGRAAAALIQHMKVKQRWDSRISSGYFKRCLNNTLTQLAVLHMAESDPSVVGLPTEGLVCCCQVCKRGHRGFLEQENVVSAAHTVPLLTRSINGAAGPDAARAAAVAIAAATAGPAVPPPHPQPSQGSAAGAGGATASDGGTDSSAAAAAATNDLEPGAPIAAGAAAPGTAPAAAGVAYSSATPGGRVHGMGGSWLPERSRPAGWQEARAKLLENPLQRFKPYVTALVIHGISFDGLRRVAHLAKAGTSTTHTNPARFRFVPDDYVAEFAGFAGKSTAATTTCNNFDADRQLGRASNVYDISGVVGMFCRHGHVLAAVNMPVGEKWAYAICLLHILMCIHNVWPYISFYDINCKWAAHCRDFANLRSGWSALLVAWALAMAMPLPPFHINMHNPDCIERHTLKQVDAAGRGAGEPAEVSNRFLGLSGMVLQYASKPVRELWLEVMMLAWRNMKEADLPRLLVSMYSKAVAQERLGLAEQQELTELALQFVSEEQVEQMLLPPPPVTGPSSSAIQLTWRAEMAELLLAVGMLQQSSELTRLSQIFFFFFFLRVKC